MGILPQSPSSKKSPKELGLAISDEVSVEVDKKQKKVTVKPKASLSKEDTKIAELQLTELDNLSF